MMILMYKIFLMLLMISKLSGQSLLTNQNNFDKNYFIIRDTIYTLYDHIIEVYLPAQKGYLHFRDGRIFEFNLSTGDGRLHKGVETPEGIFVIQNKARKVYSRQFDSTLMLNWMGFNLNIGFHALLGRAYYKYLGKRVSSHGCIRLSREDSEYLYKLIEIGTPVFIHSGKSARVVAFAEKNNSYKFYDSKNLNRILNQNLNNLYAGLYLHKRIPVVISHKNVSHKGIEHVREDLIPPQLPTYQTYRNFHITRNLFEVIKID
jgi:hypothetical protein